MQCETVTPKQAQELTGLPDTVIVALVQSGEIPAQRRGDEWLLSKPALLGWCKLFAGILSAVIGRYPRKAIGGTLSARSLVWMAQADKTVLKIAEIWRLRFHTIQHPTPSMRPAGYPWHLVPLYDSRMRRRVDWAFLGHSDTQVCRRDEGEGNVAGNVASTRLYSGQKP